MRERQQLCTFWLDGLLFGIDVCTIREVLGPQPIRRVPLARESITGLLNLRGQVVTAIDLRVCLNLPRRNPLQAPANIIVRVGEETVSFLVDKIGDIQDVDPLTFETSPETLRGIAVEMLLGMYKLKDCLLLALDAPSVVHRVMNVPQGSDEQNEKDPPARGG